MRPFALSLALVASAQLVLSTTPALAQGPTTPSSPSSPPPATAPTAPPAAPSTPPATGATPAGDTGAPAPTEGTAAPATPATAPSAEGTVEVHINAPSKINLERRSAADAPWEFVCESPCDARVPATDQYRVVGANLNDSAPFYLDAAKGDKLTIGVAPGEKNKEKIGLYVLIGGAVFFVTGIIVIAAGQPNRWDSDGTLSGSRANALAGGITLMTLGVAGAVFGGAWMWGNAHSRVGGDTVKPSPARGSLPPASTAGLRTPDLAPAAFTIPVFAHTF